jgi:OOP family OmpA-OmpF porin
MEVLGKVAGLLKTTSTAVAILEGHSDSTGDAGYNRHIAENRAISARNFLVARGIESFRFTISSFGSDKPVETNETPEGRAKNRRVVIHIMSGRQG